MYEGVRMNLIEKMIKEGWWDTTDLSSILSEKDLDALLEKGFITVTNESGHRFEISLVDQSVGITESNIKIKEILCIRRCTHLPER